MIMNQLVYDGQRVKLAKSSFTIEQTISLQNSNFSYYLLAVTIMLSNHLQLMSARLRLHIQNVAPRSAFSIVNMQLQWVHICSFGSTISTSAENCWPTQRTTGCNITVSTSKG